MTTLFGSSSFNSDVHLVDVDLESLPCMLCSPSNNERFNSMRTLLQHFTNEHMSIHLYGCHLCNQAMSSYPDFIMHDCFAGKEEFELNDPKFTYCHAFLICSDCGIQFLLNGTVANKQSMHEYLSLMAVHNSISMKLVCIYSIGVLKKDSDYFYMNYTPKMSRFKFLCKKDAELRKCCPSLCPKYYDQNSVGLATFARTAKQSECLELINMFTRMKSASVDDVLSPVIQTELKIRNLMHMNGIHKNNHKSFNISDENLPNNNKMGCSIKFCVSNFQTCIPKDILKGFMFEKDIYECSGCLSLFDGLTLIQNHWKECPMKNASLTKFDPTNPRCVRLIFNKNSTPSSRITCNKCPDRGFCSLTGLRLHYARDHSLFVEDEHEKLSNKKDIKTYGMEIVTKSIDETLANGSIHKFEGSRTRADSLSSEDSSMQNSRSNRLKWGVASRISRLSQENKPKRVSFTRFVHKRREPSTTFDEIMSLQSNNIERSITPTSSSSEMPRRRPNPANLSVEEENWRSIRRSRTSRSPNVADDHNSSGGSMVDSSQSRTRPRSERAKQMELKKQEKARREKENEEKEDQEREKRRRRKLQEQSDETPEFTSNLNSQPPVLIAIKPPLNNNESSPKITPTDGASARKKQKIESNSVASNDFEIIDLSDDSDEIQTVTVANNTESKVASRTSSQQSNLSENCSLFCFFCGQDIAHTVEFVHHMERHTEVFHRCPVCIVQCRKEHQFKHVLHVIDHIVEKHIRMDDDACTCPFCNKNFGPLSKIYPLYLCFQHILFSCDRSKYCMLCLATNDEPNVYKLRENFVNHCNQKHTYVYNKFICSKCMTGFPTKFLFINHTCNYTHRCACDISRPFPNKQSFFEHERNADDNVDHYAIKSFPGPCGIYLPNSYRKQLKTMEIELCKQRKINYPERSDYILFFQKYPHLFLSFEPLSTLAKNLPIIKTPLDESQSKQTFNSLGTSNKNQNDRFGTYKSFIISEEPTDIQHTIREKPEKQTKKRRRKQNNPNDQILLKPEPAKCLRSDVVWKEAAKYNGELDEIADVVEDLILSVSDTATCFANGLLKPTRPFKRPIQKSQHPVFIPPSFPQKSFGVRLVKRPQSDFAAIDSSPLMQHILNVNASFNHLLGPTGSALIKPKNLIKSFERLLDDDDEIEFIGEIKGQEREPFTSSLTSISGPSNSLVTSSGGPSNPRIAQPKMPRLYPIQKRPANTTLKRVFANSGSSFTEMVAGSSKT